MNTCKNCRHWEHITTMEGKQYTECNAVNWADRYDKIEGNNFAVYGDAADDTGLDAGLKTGPDFSCVQFRPKQHTT